MQIKLFVCWGAICRGFTFGGCCVILICSGSVAQLVEQRPEEPCVVGSSPTGATKEIIFNRILIKNWQFASFLLNVLTNDAFCATIVHDRVSCVSSTAGQL